MSKISLSISRKRHNVSDHRVRTIDLPFQNHAQAGLRAHRIVIRRLDSSGWLHRSYGGGCFNANDGDVPANGHDDGGDKDPFV